MIRWLLAGCLAFSVMVSPSFSQGGEGYGLEDCISYGLEHSYLKQAGRLVEKELEADLRVKTSAYYPQVDAYTDYINYFNDLPTYIFPPEQGSILSNGSETGYFPLELGLPHNANLGLKIEQVIYDHNFFLADKYKAQVAEVNQLKEKAAEEEIVFNISQVWYQLLAIRAKHELIEYNLTRLDRIEKMLDVQISHGFAREIEKGKIEMSRSRLNQSKDMAGSGYGKLLYYLKFLMGMPVETPLALKTDSLIMDNALISAPLSAGENIQVELMDQQVAFNQLEEDRIRNDYMPSVNAFANFRLQAQREAFNFFNQGQDWFLINFFGVRLDIPLTHGGRKRRQIEASKIRASAMELQKKQLEESLRMDYVNTRNELLNQWKTIEMEEENVCISGDLYRQTTALYEEGLAMLRELLETEAAYREAGINLITARYQYKIAELKYLKATGNLLSYTEIY